MPSYSLVLLRLKRTHTRLQEQQHVCAAACGSNAGPCCSRSWQPCVARQCGAAHPVVEHRALAQLHVEAAHIGRRLNERLGGGDGRPLSQRDEEQVGFARSEKDGRTLDLLQLQPSRCPQAQEMEEVEQVSQGQSTHSAKHAGSKDQGFEGPAGGAHLAHDEHRLVQERAHDGPPQIQARALQYAQEDALESDF